MANNNAHRGQEECHLPKDWHEILQAQWSGSASSTEHLFNFGACLYAKTEQGVCHLMDMSPTSVWWATEDLPDTIDPNDGYECVPVGDYLYLVQYRSQWENGMLYFMHRRGPRAWHEVVKSIIQPTNDTIKPTPLGIFKGQVYGWYYGEQPGFHICRSSDVGKTTMKWEIVAYSSFGNPIENITPAFLLGGPISWGSALYNDLIWIGTNTRKRGSFGDVATYTSDGVEVWESSTGDVGSWSRMNEPGFGTETVVSGNTIRTNQEIQSATIGFDGNSHYLFVGTASHFSPGGEIWRYHSMTGWQNMTPRWPPSPGHEMVRRFRGLVSWDRLYAAEGFPSGNLGAYDYSTNTWTRVEEGPHTFGPENQGILSLAAGPYHNLFAMTGPDPTVAPEEKKVRVWAARVVCDFHRVLLPQREEFY